MVTDSKLGFILLLLLFLAFATEASLEDEDYKQCKHKVMNWASYSLSSEIDDNNKHELLDFLFFLHVPRTGGRTYNRCLLQKMNLNSRDCLSSYGEFRFDPSKCRLLSSHDDYSVMSKLLEERTSVMTIVRNPIERVLSTFEFSAGIASRAVKHVDATSTTRTTRVGCSANRTAYIEKRTGIWPWKYLVPWMEADQCARRDARELRGQVNVTNANPYDMEDFLMPLEDYIYDPVVRELVHNGATFQIAGLTNNSIFEEAHEARHCVMKYQNLGNFVLDIAKKRLDNMLFVGLTEKHRESASMFANIVGPQVMSQNEASSSHPQVPEAEHSPLPPSDKELTVERLIEIYESCSSSSKESGRWLSSLKQISNVKFTKETRRLISEEIIEEIASLNGLDIELHNYAKQIFTKQQQRFSKSITAYTSTTPESFSKAKTLVYIFMSLVVVAGLMLLVARYMSIKFRRISAKAKL